LVEGRQIVLQPLHFLVVCFGCPMVFELPVCEKFPAHLIAAHATT
jgi:hypothetical protein